MPLTKDWKDRPFGPNAGESLADYEARLATYAAANPTLVTALDALALEDLESRAAAEDALRVSKALVTAKGDLIGASASGVPARVPVGTNGQVLTADSTQATGLAWGTAASGTVEFPQTFTQPGTLTVGKGTTPFTLPFHATLVSARATVSISGAPTGASVIVDVNRNGVTVFTTQANRPTIPAFATHSQVATPDATGFSAGDDVTVDIDQVGSTVAGSDLAVTLYFQRAASGTAPLGIDFVAADHPTEAAGQNFSVARPTGTTTGDIIIAAVAIFNTTPTSSSITVTPPAGWTEITAAMTQNAGATPYTVHIYWRRDDGTAGPWTFTVSASVVWRAWFSASYRGAVAAGSPVDVNSTAVGGASSTTVTATTVTPTVANDRLLFISAVDNASTYSYVADPAGMERRVGGISDGTVGNNTLFLAGRQLEAAAATGSVTATLSAARWTVASLIALKKS